MRESYLGQLPLGLPRPGQRVMVAAMKLAGDVARDADAGRRRAGVGHGPRHLRPGIVAANGRGGGGVATGVATLLGACVAQAEVLNKAGERHVDEFSDRCEQNGGCKEFERWDEEIGRVLPGRCYSRWGVSGRENNKSGGEVSLNQSISSVQMLCSIEVRVGIKNENSQ